MITSSSVRVGLIIDNIYSVAETSEFRIANEII